jgi:hypothetical protein
MQHLVNEIIVKCHTNLNLFAENVIRMLTLLATSSEPDVAAAAAETVSFPEPDHADQLLRGGVHLLK